MKKVLIIILAIIVLPFIVALFTSKDYAVEKEITISKDKTTVFNYIKHLKNQDNYSVWAQMDPDMTKSFKGEDATVGFVAAWESKNDEVGKGEQEITAIQEGEKIDFELRFMEPFETKDHAYMITESVNDAETNVKWGFEGSMAYPANIFLLLMDMEQMLGGDLEKGLKNLKVELEK